MKLKMKNIKKRDYNKAIQFAIIGMHFNWYLDSKFLLNLYGRYFWYLELSRATQVIAAYMENELVGVLLADIKGEKKKHKSIWQLLYIKVFDFLKNTLFKGGIDVYDKANKEMYAQYLKNNLPDGEIIFLAASPESKIKGIGSRLLKKLEQNESGKKIYLYTDNACTYQFYEHRGFERSCQKNIILRIGKKKVPLKCLLYSKVLG